MPTNYVTDFSKKTLSQLARKDIQIIGKQAIPAFEGDCYFSGTAYTLSFKGKGFVRSHSQVIVLAQSSWNPSTDLTTNYVIVDRRDNTYFSGQTGWSHLEENAIWYDKEEADALCAVLNLKFGNNLYVAELL